MMKEAEVRMTQLLIGVITIQGMWDPLEVGNGKEANSSLELLEGMQYYQYFDFSSLKFILDF